MYVMYQCSLFAGRASLGTIATVTAVATATATSAAAAAAPTVESISLALAFGTAACGLGQSLAGALGLPSINLAAMAVVASLFASVGSSLTAKTGTTAATPFKGDYISKYMQSLLARWSSHMFYAPSTNYDQQLCR